MSNATNATKNRIAKVAVLRVEGMTWPNIAKKFRYASADSARKCMTWDHPEIWRTEYEEALDLYLDETASEGILTNRELLRPCKFTYDDHGNKQLHADGTPIMEEREERIRQSAAHSLQNHAAKMRAQAPEQHVTVPVNVNVHNSTAPIPDAELLDACRAAGLAVPAGISRGILDADGSDLP